MYEELYAEGRTAGDALERLARIIRLLRSEDGCPWDRAQTHETLKVCLIEEAYEVIEAIDQRDFDNMEEELGDVLLQVVLHADLGASEGNFDLTRITNRECEKMIRRHPHVFLDKNAETIDKALEKWENVKSKEKGATTRTKSMQGIPKELPALLKSQKIQKKAADVGFDWDNVDEAFGKITEETEELLFAYQAGDSDAVREELGDLLFSVVNVARFLQINPEEALNFTSQKFIDRFSFIESSAIEKGKSLDEMSLSEMDKLWDQAKEAEHR